MFSRHSHAIVVLLLAGMLANQAIGASVVVDPSTIVHLTPANWNPATERESVLNSAATPNGIFATGFTDHDRTLLWAFTIARDGAVAWKVNYGSGRLERPYIVGAGLDGGYWIAGVAYTRDVRKETDGNPHWMDVLGTVEYDYIRRFDRNGNTSEILPISPIGNDHFFECGLEVPGGYILTGWASAGPRYKKEISPWIEMIDRNGKKLWERTFVEQQNRLLGMNGEMGFLNQCSGLQVTPDGRITWVSRVKTHHLVDTPQGRQAIWMLNSGGFWGDFLAQLDAQGNPISLSFRQELKYPTLLKYRDGFVLLEYPLHQDQHPSADAINPDARGIQLKVDMALKVQFLDASLHEIRSWVYKADDRWSHVETAVQTPEGGLLLGTCYAGSSALMYLNAAGALSARVSIDFDRSHCDRMVITEGAKKGEALLLAFNAEGGARSMIVDYAD